MNWAADRWRVPPCWTGGTTTAVLPTTGSVSTICSTCSRPEARLILAPKASTSYSSETTVAPSTAVKPATVSTALLKDACHSFSVSGLEPFLINLASLDDEGATEYVNG